jgi:hypothetical protein
VEIRANGQSALLIGPDLGSRILSPARLPSVWRWSDIELALVTGFFQGITTPLAIDRIVVALGSHGQHVQKNCRSRGLDDLP